jgi:hypothetical protein
MTSNSCIVPVRFGEELKRPPFRQVSRPKALDVDPEKTQPSIATSLRAPNETSFQRQRNRGFNGFAGYAVGAIKIAKLAPMIGLRIDYLRASAGD